MNRPVSLESQPPISMYVREWDDEFLALFPHRYDYIWAEHPAPGDRPQWQTESRHPLSDRLIQQGAYLYGVRHGATTNYVMVDIDWGSQYHPVRDRNAINRIATALEVLGLVSYIPIVSSYRKGIHLYFPFEVSLPTWDVAIVVEAVLSNAGFKVAPGQLEIFPNAKGFSNEGFSLYAAHRLPIQSGSYILSDDWEPTRSDQTEFVHHWKRAQSRNDLDQGTLQRAMKRVVRKRYKISTSADKFLNDLKAEVFGGWTGQGQTNRILGRIAMLLFIFGHVLHGGTPLEGEELAAAIASTARSLPGYEQYCAHQHEIEKRAQDWAECISNSRYFHYGSDRVPDSTDEGNGADQWNQQQANDARKRIQEAVQTLLQQRTLPEGATARFNLLKKQGIGSDTLYENKNLWHPESFNPSQEAVFPPSESISLGGNGGDPTQSAPFHQNDVGGFGGVSTAPVAPLSDPSDSIDPSASPTESSSPSGVDVVKQVLKDVRKFSQDMKRQVSERLLRRKQLSLFPSDLDNPPDDGWFQTNGSQIDSIQR